MCCLITSKPKGINLPPEKNLWAGFDWNDEGAGFAYVDDEKNELVVKKGFFKFNKFMDAITPLEDKELLIHFRKASPGMAINKEMCHPFFYQSVRLPQFQFAMVHNGRLDWHSDFKTSDTANFAQHMLWPILEEHPWFLDTFHGKMFMFRAIQTKEYQKNKMVIMRYDREEKKTDTVIINAQAGENAMGCWFSNDSYKPFVAPVHVNHGLEHMTDGMLKYCQKWNPKTQELEHWQVWTKRERLEREAKEAKEKLEKKAGRTEQLQLGNPPGRIEVPRDDGVIEFPDSNLGHLTKNERKELRRIAWAYYKEAQLAGRVGVDARFSNPEAIAWMRSDFREGFVTEKEMDDKTLDVYIIKFFAEDPAEFSNLAQQGHEAPKV
jgi:predicted glutamine amidotransferase